MRTTTLVIGDADADRLCAWAYRKLKNRDVDFRRAWAVLEGPVPLPNARDRDVATVCLITVLQYQENGWDLRFDPGAGQWATDGRNITLMTRVLDEGLRRAA